MLILDLKRICSKCTEKRFFNKIVFSRKSKVFRMRDIFLQILTYFSKKKTLARKATFLSFFYKKIRAQQKSAKNIKKGLNNLV
jgi:hypothetical protein